MSTDSTPKTSGVLNDRIPPGPLAEKWQSYKDHARLVHPANKRKYTVLVVGTGLAGASAASALFSWHAVRYADAHRSNE